MKLIIILLLLLSSFSSIAKQVVRVGVYDFPPYAFVEKDISGITVEMINIMNKFQDKYQFEVVPTTSRRRYHDFNNHKYDMIMFENINWGWQGHSVDVSHAFVKGFEVYTALNTSNRDQSFFYEIKEKTMIGVLGYHYNFSSFKTDLAYLEKNFNLVQTDGQKQSLDLILNKRGDIAVLSKEYLNYHFNLFPKDKNKILISDKYDQIYRHTILLRQNHSINISYINQLLLDMQKHGSLQALWQQYGLEEIHNTTSATH